MQELRVALRSLARQPGMAALAVVALALGIGLTTTMFSIVNGAVLRGLPFPEPDRILHVAPFSPAEQDDRSASMRAFADIRDRQQSFEQLAAFRFASANIVGPSGVPARYGGAAVTANTFRLLRAVPVAGRDFQDDDGRPGAAPVVIIGDRVWQEQFDRSPDAIGQPLRVNGTVMTVVGVMAPAFRFPATQDLWFALVVEPTGSAETGPPALEMIGRLRRGVDRDEAAAEQAVIWRQLAQADPDHYDPADTIEVKTYVEEFIGSETVGALLTMLAAVFGVLLVACVNVANLVLARAAARTREMALRTAIGASRWQVMRIVLLEVLILAAIGATAGVALAQAGVSAFNRAIVDTNPPFWIDIRIDLTVLGFVATTAVVAAVAAGIVPAIRSSRADLASVLGDEGRTTGLRLGRLSRALVIAELAVSFGLLAMAGLTIQSLANLAVADFGYAMRDVWTARLLLPEDDYPEEARRRQFAEVAQARLAALPGVVSAAVGTSAPNGGPLWPVTLPGQTYATERDRPLAHGIVVSPDYFRVLRVEVAGRPFDARDHETGAPVAIVNRAFADRHFPDGAVGQRVALATTEHREWRTVVGVVPDLGAGSQPGDTVREVIYVPVAQVPMAGLSLYAHVAGSPLAVTAEARDAIRAIDANLPLFSITTLQEGFDRGNWPFRVFGSLFVTFGAAALFLATVGLYGVMAFSVRRRTSEIGIRRALGADARLVLAMVLRQGLWQIVAGIVLGGGLGVALGTAMSLLLFGVRPYDPGVFVGVAATLAGAGVLACLLPARRAAAVDPMAALRHQ